MVGDGDRDGGVEGSRIWELWAAGLKKDVMFAFLDMVAPDLGMGAAVHGGGPDRMDDQMCVRGCVRAGPIVIT